MLISLEPGAVVSRLLGNLLIPALTFGTGSAFAPTSELQALSQNTDPVSWPIAGVVYKFPDIPSPNWESGHRGIDITVQSDGTVYAPVSGIVTWIGEINQVPSLTITATNGLKHSLMPIVSEQTVGDYVSLGEMVGMLAVSNHCGFVECLHWGVRDGDRYLDPRWLVGGMFRLLP